MSAADPKNGPRVTVLTHVGWDALRRIKGDRCRTALASSYEFVRDWEREESA